MSTDRSTNDTALAEALACAKVTFKESNPESEKLYNDARSTMPGGNTRTPLHYSPFPISMERGEGTYLFDADGHKYVDFLCEYTAAIYGHSNPKILETLHRTIDNGINLSSQTKGEVELSSILCSRFSCFDSVRFTNSGTEANLMAIAAARCFTGKDKVVVFSGSYHGGPLSYVSGNTRSNVPFDLLIAPYNDLEGSLQILEQNAKDIAAVLVEPMLGAGGCIPASKEFLSGLRTWVDGKTAILIFDEVMTSRLAPEGLQSVHEIRPDMTTMGKYIGGGMPIGVFGGRKDIMDQFDPTRAKPVMHAGTFNNNVLTMQAAIQGLKEIYTPEKASQLNEMGEGFRQRLNSICERFKAPLHFTGFGSVMNLHSQSGLVTRPEQVGSESGPLKNLIFFDMLAQGIYFAPRGLVVLNCCTTEEELSLFEKAFTTVLEKRRDLW